MAVTWRQDAFRISNDDGSETTATYQAALNTNGSRVVPQNFRLRFLVSEQGSTAGTLAPTLYYKLNAGAYTRVNASSSVARPSASSQFADGAATTRAGNSRAIGSGTFVAGSMDEVDGALATTGSIARYSETELEFCVQLQAASVASGDLISFRVYNGTSALATYSQTPTITAGVALTGTGAEAVVKAALAGSGAETFAGSGALADPHPTLAGTAAEIFTGTAAASAAKAALAVSGTETFAGTGAELAQTAALGGSGTIEDLTGVTGAAAVNCAAPSLSATGVEAFSATGAIAARAHSLAATGFQTVSGTASVNARPAALTGSGAESFAGAGALTPRPAALAGSGQEQTSGSGTVTPPPPGLAAVGTEGYSGTAAISALPPTLTSSGTVEFGGPVTGTATFMAPAARLDGLGWLSGLEINGIGSLSAAPSQFSASGAVIRARRCYGRPRLFRRWA